MTLEQAIRESWGEAWYAESLLMDAANAARRWFAMYLREPHGVVDPRDHELLDAVAAEIEGQDSEGAE